MQQITVKQRDRYATTWSTGIDLTGATVRLIARAIGTGVVTILPHTVPTPLNGDIIHTLDGTLLPGSYQIEAELTRGAYVATAPSDDYSMLIVIPDLA